MFHSCKAFKHFWAQAELSPCLFLVVVISRFGGIFRITVTAQNLDFYHATRVTHVSFLYVKFMARPLVSLHAFYVRLCFWYYLIPFFAVLSRDIRFCLFFSHTSERDWHHNARNFLLCKNRTGWGLTALQEYNSTKLQVKPQSVMALRIEDIRWRNNLIQAWEGEKWGSAQRVPLISFH